MATTHEGVSCDNCMQSNFSGKRYKCLICYDFDLCSECYEQSISSAASRTSTKDKPTSKSGSKPTSNSTSNSKSIQINQHQHLNTHAMQCILTRSDHDLFYGTGILNDFGIGLLNGSHTHSLLEQSSFTCPYCARPGYSQSGLCDHIVQQHAVNTLNETNNHKREVVCPICAVLPSSNGGDPNHLTDNLLQHIQSEHLSSGGHPKNDDHSSGIIIGGGSSSSSSNASTTNNNSGTNAAAAAAAAALRFSRRLNYSQNTSRTSLAAANNILSGGSSSSSSGIINNTAPQRTTAGGGTNSTGGSINRYAFQFGATNSSSSALSSFMRSASSGSTIAGDSMSSQATSPMDPIAELLSQLTGVRRAAQSAHSTNLQLQQLQAQLNRERESLQQQSAAAAVIAAAAANSSSTSGGGTSASSRGHHHHHLHHHLFGGTNSGGAASLSKSQLLNSLAGGNASKSSSSGGVSAQNAASTAAAQAAQNAQIQTTAFTNQILELPPNLFAQSVGTARDSRFLLSKYDFSNIVDNPSTNLNSNKTNVINQSLFINDIILSIISKQLNDNTNLNDSVASIIKNEDDLLIIDDFVEQPSLSLPLPVQQQQSQLTSPDTTTR